MALESNGGNWMRMDREARKARLVQLLAEAGIHAPPEAVGYRRLDSVRPVALVDGTEYTCGFVPMYKRVMLMVVEGKSARIIRPQEL